MSSGPQSILAVFAHPDYEIGVGSTLARYHDVGVITMLVCASRGEAATIYCDACATRENLAEVRTHELECACQHLGISELRWLDWPDGGIQALPRAEAVGQVVTLIRELRPDIIITHPANGLYPHPDHLAVWEIVRVAFDAAADPLQYPATGAPWAAARLFTRAIPQSFMDASPDFAQYRVELNGAQLPFLGTPDDQIDVIMEVTPWVERRMAAWSCHLSQHNPNGAFAMMPDGMRQTMVENEQFVTAAARIPLPVGITDDLLAGLEHRPDEAFSAPDFIGALRSHLSACHAHLLVYDAYLHHEPEPHVAALLRELEDREQEIVYLLARAMRSAGEIAKEVPPKRRLVTQALSCRSTPDRLSFLQRDAQSVVDAYRSQLANAATTEERATWKEPLALAQAQLSAIRDLSGTNAD